MCFSLSLTIDFLKFLKSRDKRQEIQLRKYSKRFEWKMNDVGGVLNIILLLSLCLLLFTNFIIRNINKQMEFEWRKKRKKIFETSLTSLLSEWTAAKIVWIKWKLEPSRAMKRPWKNKFRSPLCSLLFIVSHLKQRKKRREMFSRIFFRLTDLSVKKSFFKQFYILPSVRLCRCRSSEMCYEVVKVNNKKETNDFFLFSLTRWQFSTFNSTTTTREQDFWQFFPFSLSFLYLLSSVLCFSPWNSWKRLIFTARPYHFCRCWKRGLIWQLGRASFGCESTCWRVAGKMLIRKCWKFEQVTWQIREIR